MTEDVQTKKSSSMKREIAATVVATGVGIALSVGTNILIGKLTMKVRDKIAPQDSPEE